jgi:hypothetical protein
MVISPSKIIFAALQYRVNPRILLARDIFGVLSAVIRVYSGGQTGKRLGSTTTQEGLMATHNIPMQKA